MATVNFYPGGNRAALGGQTNRIQRLNTNSPQLNTAASARYDFATKMIEALTAKAQENRERKDQAAFMAAATTKGFDPSKMAPMEEESPYLAAQRATMAQALAGTSQSPLGGSVDDVFPPQTMPVDGMQPSSLGISVDDVFSPPTGRPLEEGYVEPASIEGLIEQQKQERQEDAALDAGQRALFGADPASNPAMQAALIGDVGTRAEDEADYLAKQEAAHIGPQEAMSAYAPTTAAGETLKFKYQLDEIVRDRALQEEEAERQRKAGLLVDERAFVTTQAANLAASKNADARASGSSETWGKTPVWGEDADGNDVLGVISDEGNFKEMEVPSGFTPQRDITADRALDTARVGRLTSRVDKGVAASEAIPILKRSLELLEGIETGGLASMRLKARRVFGVEGANEAELSYALGKSVLSQLKSIFGAAFTVTESQKLEDLEAGLGKSTEGNIRIIKNLLRQNEQFYKQGRTAAFESDDLSTYESMQEAYGLTYGPSGDGDGAGATVENGTGEDDITEEDIQLTMKKRNMTREDVVKMLQEQGRIK